MCALIHNCVLHAGKSIEDDGSTATLDVVDGSLNKRCADCEGDGKSVQRLECLRHLVGWLNVAVKMDGC